MEIDETPGIHCSAVVKPIHCSLLRSLQVRQRNEFFTVTQNISPSPHYIPCGEPFTKIEENTQVTDQLLANHLAVCCLLSALKILRMKILVVRSKY